MGALAAGAKAPIRVAHYAFNDASRAAGWVVSLFKRSPETKKAEDRAAAKRKIEDFSVEELAEECERLGVIPATK